MTLPNSLHIKKSYNKAIQETQFVVGDRVVIYYYVGDMSEGRKLGSPCLGPYVVEEVLSPAGYLLPSEVSDFIARSDVNRLLRMSTEMIEPKDPREDVFPDTRRFL